MAVTKYDRRYEQRDSRSLACFQGIEQNAAEKDLFEQGIEERKHQASRDDPPSAEIGSRPA
jgi:hypothetical protein